MHPGNAVRVYTRWLSALFMSALALMCLSVLAAGCDDGASSENVGDAPGADADTSGDNGPLPDTTPVPVEAGEYTYRLDTAGLESAGLTIWTTPATHRVAPQERAPEEVGDRFRMSAARNEREAFQFMIDPGVGEVEVAIADFDQQVGAAAFYRVDFEDGFAERLNVSGSSISVSADGDATTPIWLIVEVTDDAPAGLHETTVSVTPAGGNSVEIPLEFYVFDFALPDEVGFATQLNVSVEPLIVPDGNAETAHSRLLNHRFTPKSPTWPSGFRYNITWDSDANPQRCQAFYDEPDEGAEFAIGTLARRYILGENWQGSGYPNAMLFQFVDNSTPRPDTFCGESRGDHYGSAAYNAAWSAYLSALEGYLDDNGMLEKGYYYVQNEPQNDEDHRLAAHLCRLTKAAAPNLRIAISEEPKPEIAEDADGACGYDIWIAHIRAFQEDYALERQRLGEELWFYSLDQDPDPYFNPTAADSLGMDFRIIPWVSWRYRARGWAYYDFDRFIHGLFFGVRAELFREGIEDYEYLLLANGGAQPQVDVTEPADATALSVASSLTSWNKDVDAMMALRHELGLYIEGSRDTLPTLSAGGDLRPRAPYYINFQDPDGPPTADPLEVDGQTWMKVGWSAWDEEVGYGWSGENIGNPGITLYGYDDAGGVPETQKSYLYDDYGRDNLFEFELENGRYEVTLGVGRPARGYPGDPHNATVEGQVLVDDEVTTDSAPLIVRSTVVDLTDGSLSLEVGGRSESSGDWAYTFVGFLSVVPAD